jgi:hypothetical protein
MARNAIHPGEHLADAMEAMGLTATHWLATFRFRQTG